MYRRQFASVRHFIAAPAANIVCISNLLASNSNFACLHQQFCLSVSTILFVLISNALFCKMQNNNKYSYQAKNKAIYFCKTSKMLLFYEFTPTPACLQAIHRRGCIFTRATDTWRASGCLLTGRHSSPSLPAARRQGPSRRLRPPSAPGISLRSRGRGRTAAPH